MSGLFNVLWSFAFIATGGLLFGYVIGISSNVITTGQLLCEDNFTGIIGTSSSWGYNQCYNLNKIQTGLLTSLNLIGACISSLVCFRYADTFGRKFEMQLGAMLYIVGAAVAAVCPMLWGTYIGFLIYGLGIGFSMHAAPVYIAEISPANVRGTLVSGKEAVIVLGMFLGFLAGFIFSYVDTYGWRFMFVCGSGMGFIMLAGISFLPESPRFLVLQLVRIGGLDVGADNAAHEATKLKAKTALQFFRQTSTQEVEQELQVLIQEIKAAFGRDQVGKDSERQALLGGAHSCKEMLEAFNYPRPLVVGCGIVLLQQITGQPSILYYATNIFKAAGFKNSASAALQSVIVAVVKLIATLFTVWRVDKLGRRSLLFIGISIMVIALVMLATGFLFWGCSVPSVNVMDTCKQSNMTLPRNAANTAVVGVMFYVIGYQVGFGPIAWLLISEIFPLKVRGSALSLAALVNFGSNIAVTLFQPLLMDALTPAGLYFVYLGLAILSIVFVAFLVPETKGLSLEEIETQMTGGTSKAS